jgi:sulfite exporter TauE/SafE
MLLSRVHSDLFITMLTLPLILAAVTAGIAGGVHCVGMCGGISSMLSRAGAMEEK